MFTHAFSEWTITNVIIRVVVSMILGCIIGLDRGLKRRGAGAKTNTIVALGSTMVMLTAQYMDVVFPGQSDMSRMAAQVISGVGFLGVGTIIISGHQVKGLTTAATLWTCACVGLAVGIGFIDGAVLVTLFMLLALHVLPFLEKITYRHSKYISLYMELESGKSIPMLLADIKQNDITIINFDVIKSKVKGQEISILLTVVFNHAKSYDENMVLIQNMQGVISVESVN